MSYIPLDLVVISLQIDHSILPNNLLEMGLYSFISMSNGLREDSHAKTFALTNSNPPMAKCGRTRQTTIVPTLQNEYVTNNYKPLSHIHHLSAIKHDLYTLEKA